jgi:thioredoxin-related protein
MAPASHAMHAASGQLPQNRREDPVGRTILGELLRFSDVPDKSHTTPSLRPTPPRERRGETFPYGHSSFAARCRALVQAAAPVAFAALLAFASPASQAQVASPHAIDIPPWFVETFLDLRDDVRDAARDGKRLLVYFGQDGCPYCKQLIQTNFSQRDIVELTRERFVPLALNVWGDREVTWLDGRAMPEKGLARMLKVQFTPTVLFFDETGNVIARMNGYYPPHRFRAVLEYVSERMENKTTLAAYLERVAKDAASDQLHDEPFFLKPPFDFRPRAGRRPLAILFETRHCAACDELHREAFARAEVRAQLGRIDMARFALSDRTEVVATDGKKIAAEAWARVLKIQYTPTIVFFEERGREVLRIEAYVRPFHLASAMDYVASGAYRTEPSFQRFIQARAERLREKGETVDLWR